jgi:XTP/dITP diphosphohydrolase
LVSDPAKLAKLPGQGSVSRLLIASTNGGKLAEFRRMSAHAPKEASVQIETLPGLADLPPFDESAPTFAENAAGKAMYFSQFADLPVVADDSGLAVEALNGAPGVYSARYAGADATDAHRIAKLLREMRDRGASNRRAAFICVIVQARRGRVISVHSAAVQGEILDAPRGARGFGYDPIFFLPAAGKSFAEIDAAEKDRISHRGKAFRKLLEFVASSRVL